jgi:putative membrane-bound dehydrogenase-like protein
VPAEAADDEALRVLMLGGSSGPHQTEKMSRLVTGPLEKRGIAVSYTENPDVLATGSLSRYHALLLYKDDLVLAPQQETALLGFVEQGGGIVAVHCASACDRAGPRYAGLIGGRFVRHGIGAFRPKIIDSAHPAVAGLRGFEVFDETYVHNQFADDLRVLMVREESGRYEPYTWVRRQGKGRVFYTALGHDERTWSQPMFLELLDRAIRWTAVRSDERHETHPFARVPADLPNYVPRAKWGTEAQRHTSMPVPVSPQESIKHLVLPEGFRAELFAAEPDVVKPIAITWDTRGRAWIAETFDYPNDLQPEGKGHDRIKICDDTNGDGRADRFSVFCDKLSIPTSLVHAGGGVIVSQPPHMLFLKDTDGDDRADSRKVLFTGFGTYDTHAGPSNLRLGLDNWIWATVGYAGFRGTVGGKMHQFGQGIFRFKADGSELEFITPTSNNTWGLGINEFGDVFYSTANNEHSSYLALPNRVYEGVRGWHGVGNARMADHDRIRPISFVRQMDWHGGFTAAAGHSVYTARHFPAEFWNRAAFVCEPTAHLVHLCRIFPRGSGFVSYDGFNLVNSHDEWTSPIVAEVGPDGAVWVIDWYNYVIQHNPTPIGFKTGKGNAYETPLRDRTHGRIYRVISESRPLTRSPRLASDDLDEWVAALASDNMFWRLAAQRYLVDRRQTEAIDRLAALVRNRRTDELGNNPAALHALWTMSGIIQEAPRQGVNGREVTLAERAKLVEVAREAVTHPAPAVRRAALTALADVDKAAVELVAQRVDDPDAHVRCTALLALREVPASPVAASAAVKAVSRLAKEPDRWLLDAATAAAAHHERYFLSAALATSANSSAGNRVIRVVAEHLSRREPTRDAVLDLLESSSQGDPSQTIALVEGVTAGWPRDVKVTIDARAKQVIGALLERGSDDLKLRVARLLTVWRAEAQISELLAGIRTRLLAVVADSSAGESDRLDAARQLAQLNPDRDVIERLLEQIGPRTTPTFAAALFDAMGSATSPVLGELVLTRWKQMTPSVRRAATAFLLRRAEWTGVFLDGLANDAVTVADLDVESVQRLTNYPNVTLATRAKLLLADRGRLPTSDRQKVVAEFLPLAERTGDAGRGREVFRENCSKCHRHGMLGETIGPDLTGFAVHPKAKLLAEVLDPNSSVEANYRQYTVATTDGRILAGMLAAESRTTIELVDSEAKRHVILREDIEELNASTKSLMPEGFEKLKAQDLVDLLEFLSARGRYLPLPLGKSATVVSTRGMFYSADAEVERLIFDDWGPKSIDDVPFQLIDPRGDQLPNVILLHGPIGVVSRGMPRSVRLPCNAPAKAVHLLSGISGWGYPATPKGTISMIVRLHYADGAREDHPLVNGEHFADYIREIDVPKSKLAFKLRGRQVRYLVVAPKRSEPIAEIEFVKGPDRTAPIVMAVTIESP